MWDWAILHLNSYRSTTYLLPLVLLGLHNRHCANDHVIDPILLLHHDAFCCDDKRVSKKLDEGETRGM